MKTEAEQVIRKHGIANDHEIYEAAVASGERRVPIPRMRDSLLWKILLWLSAALSIAYDIVYGVVGGDGFGGFIVAAIFVFFMLLLMSWMIAFGFWGKKPKRAEAQRAEILAAWTLAANREVIIREQEERENAEVERVRRLRSRTSAAPDPQPYGVSPQGAERIVEAWMRHLGALDAEVTQYVGDGGIDVAAAGWIAQVKHYQGAVGVAAIRELAGVAAVDGRRALFFTSTSYATGAVEFADQAGIALFVYSAEDGTLTAANAIAEHAESDGLGAD